jgi:hypothetical protein
MNGAVVPSFKKFSGWLAIAPAISSTTARHTELMNVVAALNVLALA